MPMTVISGTIPAGGFLSSAMDASTGNPVFVQAPTLWTPANISFQISADGITFADWFDWNGKEVILPCRAGTAWLVLTDILGAKGAHMKVRSGSRDSPVVQEADRVFKFVIES